MKLFTSHKNCPNLQSIYDKYPWVSVIRETSTGFWLFSGNDVLTVEKKKVRQSTKHIRRRLKLSKSNACLLHDETTNGRVVTFYYSID